MKSTNILRISPSNTKWNIYNEIVLFAHLCILFIIMYYMYWNIPLIIEKGQSWIKYSVKKIVKFVLKCKFTL